MAREDMKTIGIWADTLEALNDYMANQIEWMKMPRSYRKPQILHDLITEARKKAGLPVWRSGRAFQTGL